MEITRIEETTQALISDEVRLRRTGGRSCIYYSDATCHAPRLQFKICRTCPRCAMYVRTNVVKSIFNHIKALGITLMRQMGISLNAR